MSKINSTSYEKLHSSSRDKFSPQQFPKLKGLAANTISTTNSIFNIELNSLSSLYKSLVNEIETLEKEINKLFKKAYPYCRSIPYIGTLSATVIYF